jgi:ABC-type Na+ transport system ATPase subunit NatA
VSSLRVQIVSVLGPNGAGKITLRLCLAGIVALLMVWPMACIRFLCRGDIGSGIRRAPVEYYTKVTVFTAVGWDLRRRFSFLPDFAFLFAGMAVVRHIGLMLRLYRAEREGV